MNNLKRVLSLGLTGAMLSGMMMVGASAASKDFGDKTEIEHTVAVETLTALNVIGGDQNGNFNPNGSLTRAEMAKLVVYVLNGGKEPVLGVKTTPTFSDIDGHWAEKYIEYCAAPAINIIGGMGDGTFAPNATLTVAQAAKMLLVAMGYEPTVFGFKGADWAMNVNIEANKAGLYKDLDSLDTNDVISRDDAAQMVFNAVNGNMMEVTKNHNSDGTVSQSYVPGTDTLLETKFDVVTEDPVVLESVEKKSDGTYSLNGTYTKVDQSYADLLGQKVNVIHKTGKTDQVFGVFADDKNVVVEGLVNQVTDLTANKSVKVDGTKYNLAATQYNIVNGTWDDAAASNLGVAADANSYDTFKLIDNNGDGKFDGTVVTTVAAAKVTYVSDKEIIAGGTTYKLADHNVDEDLAKNDYVAISYNVADDCKDIVKVEKIQGKVTADKSGDNLVQVNGVWYNDENENLTLGSEYTFYAVNGVIITDSSAAATTTDIGNLVMVLKHTTGMLTNEAIIMDANGEKRTVKVDSGSLTDGNLYLYEETEKGYKFEALAGGALAGTDYTCVASANVLDANADTTNGKIEKIGTHDIADSAVIFVYAANDGKIISGKDLKSVIVDDNNDDVAGTVVEASKGYYHTTVNGLTRIAFAGVELNGKLSDLTITSSDVNYGVITKLGYTTKIGNDTYTSFNIWTGSEDVEVFEKGTPSHAVMDVVTYASIDADKKITSVAELDVQNSEAANTTFVGAVRGIDGDYIYIDGVTAGEKYELTKDTVYLYIDSNEKVGLAGKPEIVLADKFGSDIYRDNVIVKADSNSKIQMIIVDSKNNMTVPGVNNTHTAAIPATVGYGTAALSVTANIKAGDAIELTLTANDSGNSLTVTETTIVNAQLADGGTTLVVPTLKNGASAVITLYATGAGNVSFSS